MSELVWTCGVCRLEIEDGDGHLVVDEGKVRDHELTTARLGTRPGTSSALPMRADEVAELPGLVTWKAVHANCYPREDVYWIPIADVRTEAGLLEQTAHLLDKSWLGQTNWAMVLRGRVLAS